MLARLDRLVGPGKGLSPKRPREGAARPPSARPLRGSAPAPGSGGTFIQHVSFAHGCCEADLRRATATALQAGANASRAFTGNDLATFPFRRGHLELLVANRSAALQMKSRTPSARRGYLVTASAPAYSWWLIRTAALAVR